MQKKRRVMVLIGSASDLSQCQQGLEFLSKKQAEGSIDVMPVQMASIHRNTDFILGLLAHLSKDKLVDVLIVGAGWANHLTGTCDAYLRYTLGDSRIVVVGVAFEDEKNPVHTQAACLSITEVPGGQSVFNDFVGAQGFLAACQQAAGGELPDIKVPKPKKTMVMSLEDAIALV